MLAAPEYRLTLGRRPDSSAGTRSCAEQCPTRTHLNPRSRSSTGCTSANSEASALPSLSQSSSSFCHQSLLCYRPSFDPEVPRQIRLAYQQNPSRVRECIRESVQYHGPRCPYSAIIGFRLGSAPVIRTPAEDSSGPVELLQQHYGGKLVLHGQRAKRDGLAARPRITESIGGADHQMGLLSRQSPAPDNRGEGLAVVHITALLQKYHRVVSRAS